MKNLILSPTEQWHNNSILTGETGVHDLHVTRMGPQKRVLSVWKVPFWARLRFIFDGRVNFVAMGHNHAPISITIGEYFNKPKEK